MEFISDLRCAALRPPEHWSVKKAVLPAAINVLQSHETNPQLRPGAVQQDVTWTARSPGQLVIRKQSEHHVWLCIS